MPQQLIQTLTPMHGAQEARAIVYALLEDVFGLRKTDVLLGKFDALSEAEKLRFAECARRLEQGEPLQYVVGTAPFGDLRFEVTPATLIPRPETLELVEWVVADENVKSALRLLDIGTGSGCIAISLAQLLPQAAVSAWDISSEALAVARRNAERNGVAVDFKQVDVLHVTEAETYDCIVSNPPYICEEEKAEMTDSVLLHEPHTALFVPNTDPLRFYRAIAELGMRCLSPGGTLYFEINRAYGAETCNLLRDLGFRDVELRKDFYGNDRMVKGVKPHIS
jgi:release factor glutamine methyltransferase